MTRRMMTRRMIFPFLLAAGALAADPAVMPSQQTKSDFALTANPDSPQWRGAPAVVTDRDRYGKPQPGHRTEIRSRWTGKNVYFLFIAQYESMKLMPVASEKKETYALWEFDVVEVFIGSELDKINRYKEFEVSPQNAWVDLDVDRDRAGREVDWTWDAGMRSKVRVDKDKKVWVCEIAIPWKSIDRRKPAKGNELRLNLYRIEGAEPKRTYITWQAVNSPSYHTPSAFGRLRLE